MTFGEKVRTLMSERGISQRALARLVPCDDGYLSRVARGERSPSAAPAERLDEVLDAGGELAALRPPSAPLAAAAPLDDEIQAVELVRRVAASDVGEDTLVALESAVDDLASAYPRTAPGELRARVGRYLGHVSALMDVRMTLAERRRLVVVGAWLSLLAATCDIDLGRRPSAAARLRTAAQFAEHADHREILAWTLETRAWQRLTDGDYADAITFARGAQEVAPRGGSAFIQATAQEGRAWARLGAATETRSALSSVERLVEPLPMPERPEHHFRYDPAKSDAYTATTLAWVGDPAAELYARGVLARLERPSTGPARPRRAASARLDLALALLAADQPDEAAHTALEAVTSGRLVPSNYWRAAEVIAAVEARDVPATELNEAYRELCTATGRGSEGPTG
ncbi:helix-turn-helix transcriptional regulator [Actinomadura sp. NAK00032]|uniref:helix-turn-helix domain-containing protein n=1 Tax=Actinomadura sp. NAK00032 TaxID=2742128 RepID=UPI00158FB573|nr:helix-turn-helix transcriptional regulator [Actinomadura sp. NAK00032]QKW39669.1 helix-turn-helix transcriptional regulator [Actinomadura sp. NAK00032]